MDAAGRPLPCSGNVRVIRVAAGVGIGLLSACFGRAASYSCSDNAQCDASSGGRCEPSGYCSYVDGDCPGGQRYDGLASGGLAGSCVDAGASSSTASSATTTAGSEGGTTSSDETGTDGDPCTRCEDFDGDGFGIGPDCAGPDCDDANATRFDGCFYVSPEGSDDNAGTDASAPWRTFAHAVPMLGGGDSLVLLPGEYDRLTTGLLQVDCGTEGNATGAATAEAPISIRGGRDSTEERQAIIRTDGSGAAVRMANCSFWSLHGLTAQGLDVESGNANVVEISGGSNIEIRRLLAASSNGWINGSVVLISGATDVLVEDTEVYDFHIAGLFAYESERITFRRVYTNSRSKADLPGASPDAGTPMSTTYPTEGDSGIRARGPGVRIENCVFQGPVGRGVLVESDIVVEGSIAVDVSSGLLSTTPTFTVRDFVSVGATVHAIDLRSPMGMVVEKVTLLDSAADGVVGSEYGAALCLDMRGCGFSVRNTLALRNGGRGVGGNTIVDWTAESSNAFGNGADYSAEEPIDDEEGRVRNSLSEAVDQTGRGPGQCAVFIAEDNPMHARGTDGQDIGANVLYRVVDGELTDEPLWDPTTGAFPCGAVISGINDQPGDSCFDVHERLNAGTGGCTLPLTPGECD